MLRRSLPALVLVLAALVAGCSDDSDCQGRTYDVDTSAPGEESPIDALNAWLASPTGYGDDLPPDDSWVLEDGGEDQAELVMRNDVDDGWWVHLVRTDDGGYVVDQATDDFASCEDELS